MKDGRIEEQQIDAACWRILKLKNKLGLFEDPYFGCSKERSSTVTCTPEKLSAARNTSCQSLVLLKNNGVLPLSRQGQKIALIRPYADNPNIIGMWAIHADRKYSVTLKAALEEVLGKGNFDWTAGCDIINDYSKLGAFGNITEISGNPLSKDESELEEKKALAIAKKSDIVLMAVGEHKGVPYVMSFLAITILPDGCQSAFHIMSARNRFTMHSSAPAALQGEIPTAAALLPDIWTAQILPCSLLASASHITQLNTAACG